MKEQTLARLLEVNHHMIEAQKDIRIAFSVLQELRSELDGELTVEQFQSLSDALLIVSSVFVSLLDAQAVKKYWSLDK
jgi:hypothetical protein